jgi:hypothetical protein
MGGLALLLGTLATVAACGAPAGPPTAAVVLRQAQNAPITDLRFTANGTFASALGALLGGQNGASGSTLSFQAMVTGTLTTAPKRADLALSFGQQQQAQSAQGVAVEIITDAATQTGYVRLPGLAQLGLGANQWLKLPLDGVTGYLDPALFSNFEQLTHATMVGSETIGGVAVYHLRGTQQLPQGLGSASEDFYVRQDNAFPVRVTLQGAVQVPTQVAGGGAGATGSGPAASVQVTISFTGVNTGATVSLPSSSQVVAA